MKRLATIAFGLLIIFVLNRTLIGVPASAQNPLPRTVPMNDASGKPIGTVTFSGNYIYLRDLKGVHVATIVVEPDGSQTLYDPNGNVLDKRAAK